MLPGPPPECLPMFDHVVLPHLKKSGFAQVEYHKNWLLFGASEGQIAEELDALAKPYDCMTGYRLFYPYIEFKLHSNNQKDFSTLAKQVETAMQPYLIGDGQHPASHLLRGELEKLNFELSICDFATGGLLETTIKTPQTRTHLNFNYDTQAAHHIMIKGLNEFWQNTTETKTQLEIYFNLDSDKETIQITIPFRGSRVKQYAVEFICWKILNVITNKIEKY